MLDFNDIADKYAKQIIEWRRHIHANPEVGFNEFETADYIISVLKDLGYSSIKRLAQTGVVAELSGSGASTVALRADMDALPITEETGLPYASKNEGVMHACGHDAHVAAVLGAAAILRHADKLPGNVKFIFQPSEERLPSGARQMIEEGVLENPKVDVMFGLHTYPHLPAGVIGTKPGAIMAATDIFYVEVEGKGGHGAAPHTSIDPIIAATQMINALQTIVSRKIDPTDAAVVTVGTIHAGERPNVIPTKVKFSGTIRSISNQTRNLLKEQFETVIKGVALASGVSVDINYQMGHGPLINDPKLYNFTRQVLTTNFGEQAFKELQAPSMAGEDFSIFAELVPSSYLFVGTATGQEYPWHHPCFTIDESALPFAAKALACLAARFLEEKNEKEF